MSAKKKKGPTPRKRRIRLIVIPEPEPNTRSVLRYTGEGTLGIRGEGGNVTLECGNCGAPLAEKMKTSQIQGIVLFCNACSQYNDVPI